GGVLFRADVAVDLVAARVAHGFGFGQFVAVLALADGGMVVGDLVDLAAADAVEARIAHVADDGSAFFDDRDGEDARHTFPLGVAFGGAQDLIVGHGNGFADALLDGTALAFEARAQAGHGDLGGLFAGCLAADANHDEEDAAVGIDVERIFVV